MGVITPLGNDLDTFWQNLVAGKSGIGPITHFDAGAYDCRFAGEVRGFDPALYFKKKKDTNRTDRFTQLAVAAAKNALADAGIVEPLADPERFGCMIGSGIGGLKTTEDQHTVLMNKGPGRLSPFMIPMLIGNMASGIVSMEFGLQGPNFATMSACATSAHSIGEAWRMIRDNDADAFVAGGSEAAIVPLGMGGFAAMKALSTRNEDPTAASRPWDKDRDGFVMGEGAGVIVLEELEHAKKRGARIYGEIVGYGLTSDAYHMSAPLPNHEQAQRSMRVALAKAGLNTTDVDYINAHGTSTPVGDIAEVRAVKAVFGDHARNGLLVSSTKSMTGHLLGAAGAVETVVCLKTINTGLIPPTINLHTPGEECDLDFVPLKAREAKVKVALNNSFGFGGHNVSLVARAFEG
ncbi:3-oxoacyl-(acyl-carrier-protein) synthase 2 [Chthoniobacter flavus Ellin428]|uniref:3-oxoacyl-[acyl-carrier-protein] synthase 2 n=2 Tax=Chthoniobacter flavus TaxID=191863 RepID=B4DC75_9BACT|nr:3-oxoacyl-(acyl-carrier-protein) synthase 2 [Chthoniobacter flavus Ellin428]TCO82595.1 3-oxoacyl-[acyl-carrier-protein] synthase II [Chthoniobacter flavus]